MVSETEIGVYGAVYQVYSILAWIGVLGLSYAASRYTSFYLSSKAYKNATQTAKIIIVIAVISSLAFFLVQFTLSDFLSILVFGSDAYSNLFKITSFVTLTTILSNSNSGFLQGLKKFKSLAISGFSSQIIRVIISILLLVAGMGLVAVFIGYFVFHSLYFVLILISMVNPLFKKKSAFVENEKVSIAYKTILKFSIPMMIFQLMIYLTDSIDRFIVLNLIGVIPLGIYTVALTGAKSITVMLNVPIQATLMPGMSEIYATSGKEKLSRSLEISSRYISILFIPTCVGLAVLSPLALMILAGSKYLDAAIPLSIICLGLIIFGYSTIFISALATLKETTRIAVAMLLASFLEFGFTYLLTMYFGVFGAAVSRTIMNVFMLAFLIMLSYKLMRVSLDRSSIWKASFSSAIMAIILILMIYNLGYRLLLTPVYIIVGLVVYFSILFLLKGIIKKDAELFLRLIPGGKKISNFIQISLPWRD
jgi:O-antigen/teichoic acid export membrane protein